MFVLLLLAYGFSLLPFIYMLSFCFKKPSKGQIVIFILSFFTGLFLVIVTFALRVIENTRETTEWLEFFFRIFPAYCFHVALLSMANDNLFRLILQEEEVKSAFSLDIALWDLYFLLIIAVFSWTYVFLREFSFKFTK